MHQLHRLIVLASAAAVITAPVYAQTPPDNPTPAPSATRPNGTRPSATGPAGPGTTGSGATSKGA